MSDPGGSGATHFCRGSRDLFRFRVSLPRANHCKRARNTFRID